MTSLETNPRSCCAITALKALQKQQKNKNNKKPVAFSPQAKCTA
jgi:hypothetical protein